LPDDGLRRRIAVLSPVQRAYLSHRLTAAGEREGQIIPHRGASTPAPLTPGQLGLWLIHQMESSDAAYHVPIALRLSGPLDLKALRAAWQHSVERHEALRSVCRSEAEWPQQYALPGDATPLTVTDHPTPDPDAAARWLALQEASRPFDLAHSPACRAALWQFGGDEHLLVITLHHIAADLWSSGVLVRDLSLSYSACATGRAPDLPPLPIQYGDYAHWLQGRLDGPDLREQIEHWRAVLQGSTTSLTLPTDRPRSGIRVVARRGRRQAVHVPPDLASALRSLAPGGVTPFMALLAAWQALLCRYSGQDDFVVGTVVANRSLPETAPVVGFFANTLPLRAALSGNPTLGEVLDRTRHAVMDALAHQDVPFESLSPHLRELHPPGHARFFEAMFNLQNVRLPEISFPDLAVQVLDVDLDTSKFELTLDLQAKNQTYDGYLEYDRDLYDEATMVQLAENYEVMLSAVVHSPGERLRDVVLRPYPEENRPPAAAPKHCAHEEFAMAAAAHPERPAVYGDSGELALTYGELDERANRRPAVLRRLGAAPEVMVGVCLDRSPRLAVALLAVLKSGGVYVPLGPDNPIARLEHMMSDTGIDILLTEERLLPLLPTHASRVVCLDRDSGLIDGYSSAQPLPLAQLDHAAYCLYTSGSTGRPKGTIIRHRALMLHCMAVADAFGIGPADRLLHFASTSFDVSIEQLLPPLLRGAAIVVRGNEVWSPDMVIPQLDRLGVTVANFPTAYWHQWLRFSAQAGKEAPGRLRLMIVGGEELPPDAARLWHASRLSSARLLNAYGPTEATITCTLWEVSPATDWSRYQTSVPIGHPLPDRAVYVLDPAGNPVPRGVWGELHIGGANLARGYWRRPDLTADHFVPDPFGPTPGARLYRTGDIVRRQGDGALQFAGRRDRQVKLRGFRIELGEIESALRQHPDVSAAVVELLPKEPQRLVAYLVPRSPAADRGLPDRLRAYLQDRLPPHMIPGTLQVLEELPLTSSGKLDRRALPEPPAALPSVDGEFVAPRTDVERALAAIWGEVLRVDRIGARDNFFALGGDSITALQVVARASQSGMRLTPRDLMQRQTVAALAEVVRVDAAEEEKQEAAGGDVPLTPIQARFFATRPSNPHHYNQSFVLRTSPGLNHAALAQALQALVQHHDALRLRFASEGGTWRQFHIPPEAVQAPCAKYDLSALPPAEQERRMALASARLQASLHLTKGPVVAGCFFDLGNDRPGRLVLTAHHLIVDGVSWRILLHDLDAAYAKAKEGQAPALPPKTASYGAWAVSLAECAQSERIAQQFEVWRHLPWHLAARLPEDDPGAAQPAAAQLWGALTVEDTGRLLRVPQNGYATVQEVLVSALARTLLEWARVPAIALDLEGTGRENELAARPLNVSRTVGWFTSLYPVVIAVPKDAAPGPPDLHHLRAARDALRGLRRYSIAFGLHRWLAAPEEPFPPSGAEPPQVLFNYLGRFDQINDGLQHFRLSDEDPGPVSDPGNPRSHCFEVDVGVLDGKLSSRWTYSPRMHTQETVGRLVRNFLQNVASTSYACLSSGAGDHTPDDFPLAKLSRDKFDKIASTLARIDAGGHADG